MRQAQVLRWLVAVVMVLGVSGIVLAADSADKVKMTAVADKPAADGTQVITITLDIEKEWHLYANPVGSDMLATAATKITVAQGKDELKDVKIDYPKGKFVKDADVGDHYTYEGKVEIKATVKRPSGAGPLTVSVKMQACDKSTCLKPASISQKID
jgi:DsbC/DsbD-like thiol-disulfide interchange protein